MKNINDYVILNNGLHMPIIGFGTAGISNDDIVNVVINAINVGYRHIDTASRYENETNIGIALKNCDIKREDIFITGKLWHTNHGYDNTLKAFNITINNLRTDYLDLYLMHYPDPLNEETWKALEYLYNNKYVRAIGLSNFKIDKVKEILDIAIVRPMVNQIEFHPECTQNRLREYCKCNHIQFESWSPLIRGKCVDIPLLQELALKYNESVSQIVLRWNIQLGVVTIPKSVDIMRLKENLDIFDFELSEYDMELISNLDQNKSAWNRNWD
jgi:diketogulonate reductase-like aldo/keto reductase